MKKINKNNRNKKAQVWSIDLAIAFFIFMGVILLFYKYSLSFSTEDSLINNMLKEGGYSSGILLTTGYPENWSTNLSEANSIGFLNENGLLDLNKTNNLSLWINGAMPTQNYISSKGKINTKYNYFITLYNGTGIIETIGWDFEDQGVQQVVRIQRLVAYETSYGEIRPLKLNLYLWTNETY
jgi:hypothetical protein